MEEAPWRRHQGGGIMEEESCRRHPGDTQETQEAPRRHPGDTQETQEAPRRHPGGTQEAMDILEAKCVKSIVFFQSKWWGRPLSRARERRDHHRLQRLRTKVRGRRSEKSRATNT